MGPKTRLWRHARERRIEEYLTGKRWKANTGKNVFFLKRKETR